MLAQIGYRYVQLQGAPYTIANHVITEALVEARLHCIATQEDFPLGFGDDPKQGIARAVAVGAKYLCCALIPKGVDSVQSLERFAARLGEIGRMAREAGLIFAFHPIGRDFTKIDGAPVYERLMELLPEEVQLAFCVNAAFGAKADPAKVLAKYAGRVDIVHFKDDAPRADGGRQLMPLGYGTHDWRPILQPCRESGVKFVFAEQERWLKDAFACAKDSHKYLKRIGL